MPRRVLIDATHAEETRVVVLENGRVQEFDSETAIKTQLKGNVYLAKVTRVEPSLQAAFVEYGGERHGFLPFSEIHPDYYTIPVADKQKLLQSMREQADDEEEELTSESDDANSANGVAEDASDEGSVETIDSDDDPEMSLKNTDLYRRYKIQEVIKRNQIILVQVEKEERGNKGASLTTFISLAGRYCVLMPNSLRKGGVSRKVSDYEDRKRLKSIISSLNIPKETGIIVRTAGAGKSGEDIKADYDYLAGLWNKIRKLTLSSDAPAFVHAEGDVVKRTIRDLYGDNVDELIIEGKEAYSSAKEFMKVIMPEQVSCVKQYKNKVPIFSRYRVEEQIAALYDQEAPLESGGAIVINPTEALISIDVNSGRATSKRNVEETALSTNIEAAREVARQLKLRDLSGLIVIDFIDMLEFKNRKAVEKVLKESCSDDRAKIQIGRISTFGLLEMSRQRLRPSFLEVNTMVCPHCNGSGAVKATESMVVTVLRAIENEVSKKSSHHDIDIRVSVEVAMYILNHKRAQLDALEERYDIKAFIYPDDTMGHDGFAFERSRNDGKLSKPSNMNKAPKGRDELSGNLSDSQKKTSSDQPPRESRANTKRSRQSNDSPRQTQGVGGILEGLWKKIVD